MILSIIANIFSVLVVGALLFGWLVLVWRKHRELGGSERLRGMGWLLEVVREGIATTKAYPWIIVLPLIATVVDVIGFLPSTYVTTKRYTDIGGGHLISPSFLDVATQLGSAPLLLFERFPVVAVCLLSAAFLLCMGAPASLMSDSIMSSRKRRVLAFGLGLAGVIILILHIHHQILLVRYISGNVRISMPLWPRFLAMPLVLVVAAFANAMMLALIQSGIKGSRLSLWDAISNAKQSFLPIFFYYLIITGIELVISIQLRLDMSPMNTKFGFLFFGRLSDGGLMALVSMLQFIPIILVLRQALLRSAFDECVELWARHWKSAIIFILLGAVTLTALQAMAMWGMRAFHDWEWVRHFTGFFLYVFSIAIRTIVMSSMVVFYKNLNMGSDPDM